MEPARGFWLPWKHMHFFICRKSSSLKEKFGLFVDFEFLTEMGSWDTD